MQDGMPTVTSIHTEMQAVVCTGLHVSSAISVTLERLSALSGNDSWNMQDLLNIGKLTLHGGLTWRITTQTGS